MPPDPGLQQTSEPEGEPVGSAAMKPGWCCYTTPKGAVWAGDWSRKAGNAEQAVSCLSEDTQELPAQAEPVPAAPHSARGCAIPGRTSLGSSAFPPLNFDSILITQFESQGVSLTQDFF